MQSRTTRQFWRLFSELPFGAQRDAQRAFRLFQSNPAHPGLQFKKLEGEDNIYSVRIGLEYRALAVRRNDRIVWYLNQFGDSESTQTLQSQTNHGRSTCPGECQDRVQVRVQGHYDGIPFQRESGYLLIGGLTHPDFPEVDTLMSEPAQVGCGVSRNSLIQDQAHC